MLHRVPRGCISLVTILCLFCWPASVSAHLLNMSRVEIDIQANLSVRVQLDLDLTVALGGSTQFHAASQADVPLNNTELAALARQVAAAVHLTSGDTRISLAPIDLKMPEEALETFLSGFNWPRARLWLEGRLPVLADGSVAPVRVIFEPEFPFEEPIAVTLRDVANGVTVSRWLVAEQRSPLLVPGLVQVSEPARPGSVIASRESGSDAQAEDSLTTIVWQYLVYGFYHILPDGLDHLLFVAGLFLGCRRLGRLVGLISTYTVAHTMTLGMAALSWVELRGSIVEPVIALSIAWVAFENLRGEPGLKWRLAVVFVFGLVHGLGFAQALKDAGLPADGTLWALAGFNVGVELGQLVWIGLLFAMFGYWRSHPGYGVWVVRPASIAIGIVAVYWTGQRLLM